jgi:glycosyltransferase involved in cell wall biosynthesis
MTVLSITDAQAVNDNAGFSLSSSSNGVQVDEVSRNAMGGTELMKYGLYDRLPADIRDKVQIICSRVRDIDPDRPSILWLHDLFDDPESMHLRDPELRKRFDKLVFVSNWQFSTYNLSMRVPYSESIVLRNAIDPIPNHVKPRNGTINLIYHTTPHRGLEILVPAFEALQEHYKNIHLDVYSSFEAYGWPQRDEPYKDLFERIKANPQMTYHGYKPNSEIREALKKAHIFAYPSIWQETSCIAAIEAMSAGCAVVCPNYAALPETTSNFAFDYQYHEDVNTHANVFANALAYVIGVVEKNSTDLQTRFAVQKNYIDTFYNWDKRVAEWEVLIRGILANKKA